MNYFYIAKKFNYLCGILNFVSSISAALLLAVIFYYHFFILADAKGIKNYTYLAEIAAVDGESPVVNVHHHLEYPHRFIEIKGYKLFFSGELFSFLGIFSLSAWPVVVILFATFIATFTIKSFLTLFVLFAAFKCKSIIYIYSSLMNFFIPIWGWIVAVYVENNNKKIISLKEVKVGTWIRFRLKNIWNKFFKSDDVTAF